MIFGLKMNKLNKWFIGGLTALLLGVGATIGINGEINKAEKENERIRKDLTTQIIESDYIWNAQNLEEAKEQYNTLIARYAKNNGYRYFEWMHKELKDVENTVIWKLYNSQDIRNLFKGKDKNKRTDLYKLFKESGY